MTIFFPPSLLLFIGQKIYSQVSNKATRLDADEAIIATIAKTVSTGEQPISTGSDCLAEVVCEAAGDLTSLNLAVRAKPPRHPVDR
ncbi:MAG: hypothetical protein ABSD09_18895, partial [Xanthobacteraceae bacterium]